jgi:hypothetical protein
MEGFADQADTPEELRILNAAIADLNEKMENGLSADEIQEFTNKWGGFFSIFDKDPSAKIDKVSTSLQSLASSAESSALEDYLTGDLDVAPTVEMTGEVTTIDETTIPETEKTIPGLTAGLTSIDVSGLTEEQKTMDVTARVTNVIWVGPNNKQPSDIPTNEGVEPKDDPQSQVLEFNNLEFETLKVPPPDDEEFTNAMNTLLEIPSDFVNRWNESFSESFTIPAPDVEDFADAMNTLLDVPADFIERWNELFDEFMLPPPDDELFADALNAGIDLTNQFLEDFESAMADSIEAAESARDDIQNSFNDIQTAAEDATSAVEDLQNAIDDLKSKKITVEVDATGDGLKFLAKGFHGIVNKPTVMIVGEAGAEQVDVTPTNAAPTGLNSDRNLNIIPIMSQSLKQNMFDTGESDDSIRKALRNSTIGREIVQQITRRITVPIKINVAGRTIVDIVKEELLSD